MFSDAKNDPIKKFNKDDIVFRQGDAGDFMYIVHRGKVRLLKQIRSRIETLTVVERGDFFGEMSILDGVPRSGTAIAIEDNTELVAVSAGQFEAMLQDNIDVAINMIRKYVQRLGVANARLEDLIIDQQQLDTDLQDILSNVRKRPDEAYSDAGLFGWLEQLDTEQRFPLTKPEVLIGRRDDKGNDQPDIDLTDLDNQRTVSRRHARLALIDNVVFLSEESGVTNGTFVNGKSIAQGKIVQVHNKTKIGLGKLEFRVLLV